MRKVLLLLGGALLTLAGCTGGDGGDSGGSPDAGTSLRIVVMVADDAKPETYELTCDPAGGDHPQPEDACALLAKLGAKAFAPVPEGQTCTQVFGGPQTAKVTGTYDGKQVDATFSRTDGCQVERWDRLGTTFFNVPML